MEMSEKMSGHGGEKVRRRQCREDVRQKTSDGRSCGGTSVLGSETTAVYNTQGTT